MVASLVGVYDVIKARGQDIEQAKMCAVDKHFEECIKEGNDLFHEEVSVSISWQ